MLDDFKKSIQLILRERITSPFSGAFFFSWFVWNWKMLYFLFFTDENLTLNERFNYVDTHFLKWADNFFLPILSALFFVLIYPFITTGALWIWLRFKKWQADIKNNIEGQQLLTLDQSIALRLEIENQHERLDRLTKAKDGEISLLRRESEELRRRLTSKVEISEETMPQVTQNPSDYTEEITEFLQNGIVIQSFPDVIRIIKGNYRFSDKFPSEVMAYLVGNNIISQRPDKPTFEFTEKGKAFLRAYTKQRIPNGEKQ
jgi:hypothetical protein